MVKEKIKRSYRIARYVFYKETLVNNTEHFWSFTGAFLGIGIIAFLQSHFTASDHLFLIGSFGASSVLIYGAIQSPLAQPRNLIGGHVISTLVGVTVCRLCPDIIWITAPLAVALSIISMQMTKTLHPPGGASALIAVTGSEQVKDLGYWFVFSPVLSGALILLAVALVFNNITPDRQYPTSKRFSRTFNRFMRPTSHFINLYKKRRHGTSETIPR
ncbi:hypothetical protein GCM10023091_39730 [Ravibacter arvi]|uniref:HPP transmembrane region domain-containing protein n=1 Tax=Ravibacter arvi TaxID=2051041 RepID=A0ABP8MB34_9BACT